MGFRILQGKNGCTAEDKLKKTAAYSCMKHPEGEENNK